MRHTPGFLLSSSWQSIESHQTKTSNAPVSNNIHNNLLKFWWLTPTGPLLTEIHSPSICFIETSQLDAAQKLLETLAWPIRMESIQLKNFQHQAMTACYLPESYLSKWRRLLIDHGINCWEYDIRPSHRYLMERFIYGSAELQVAQLETRSHTIDQQHSIDYQYSSKTRFKPTIFQPEFNVWSLDIETSMPKPGVEDRLFSIGVVTENRCWVWMIGQPTSNSHVIDGEQDTTVEIIWCENEIDLLRKFCQSVQSNDPDVIIGWNVIQFDMAFLQKKFNQYDLIPQLGRAGEPMQLTVSHQYPDRVYCQVPGRVVLDGIDCLKNATYQFDSFSLNDVAGKLLGQSKLITGDDRGNDIEDLFKDNPVALAAYNLQDCQLVWDIFEKTQLIDFLVERSQMTGLMMDRMGGSVAAFENLYLPRLHRRGYISPNLGEGYRQQKSPGGFVMESTPGIYQHILVLDFKSLYPSIIRTFHVDPLALIKGLVNDNQDATIEGYFDAQFNPNDSILPELIKDLSERREQAKAKGNQALSQAIKIIMASCYGVLGSEGCRFHDTRLSASITKRSHQVINQCADYIRQQGFDVIYGDTDSVFVWIKKTVTDEQADIIGNNLIIDINQYFAEKFQQEYGIKSYLELEYETHYRQFFMPALRGSDTGSKKRYAGLKAGYGCDGKDEVVFKGLEVVRSDWTRLAKIFQRELFSRYFKNIDYHQWLANFVSQCLAGEFNDLLIYRKRLRRPLSDYQYSQPPHAKAAKKYDEQRRQQGLHEKFKTRGGWIDYIMTKNGPEPIQYQSSAIDYYHYIDKQLIPIADALFQFTGEDFGTISGLQPSLF